MKTRLLIIIGIITVLGITCIAMIEIYQGQIEWKEKVGGLMDSEQQLQRLLVQCEFKRKLVTGEIPERNADGSYNVMDGIGLSYQNNTHYIDNNTCEWQLVEDPNPTQLGGPIIIPVDPALEPNINEGSTVSENKKPILTQEQIDERIDIVFGNALKSWTVFPGGAGFVPPQNSTLILIYKEVTFGLPPLNFTAMLDDKTFVNKCESNGGVWNYTYHDCEGSGEVCIDMGGIIITEDITPPCTATGIIDDDPLTINVCRGPEIVRISCVFEYEN